MTILSISKRVTILHDCNDILSLRLDGKSEGVQEPPLPLDGKSEGVQEPPLPLDGKSEGVQEPPVVQD
jgi:hypothetical protein